MLLEIPCILKHFREEKKPHGDWIYKGEMWSTKKTGTFPFSFCFKLENPNSLEEDNDTDSREKLKKHKSQRSSSKHLREWKNMTKLSNFRKVASDRQEGPSLQEVETRAFAQNPDLLLICILLAIFPGSKVVTAGPYLWYTALILITPPTQLQYLTKNRSSSRISKIFTQSPLHKFCGLWT
jgi:hypothetical protein